MNNSQTSAYIEIGTLQEWKTRLSKTNSEALETLNSYLETAKELENYMLGNVATGFINETTSIINNSKNYHNKMQDVENFLIEVIDTMNNQ
ncbi:MAG: hypothetical protein PUE33_04875 [bacterium]|nr:hypothetical protein [bacterium]